MTNLTSEQYRDVVNPAETCTEKVPTIQHLLYKAVITFFNRFGAYPEMAGVAPGKIGIFGEQLQLNDGLSWLTSTPMATIVVGRKAAGRHFAVVTSGDVGKPHKIKFSFSRHRPLAPGCPIWLNYVKGVIDNYPVDVPPFEIAIESSIPFSVGFGSSSAIETATYSFLEVLVGKKSRPLDKAMACQKVEKDYAFKEVGLADRITAIFSKDRRTLLTDSTATHVEWIPFNHRNIAFVAIDSHEPDKVYGHEYPERSKYLEKACEMLGVKSLRNCTEEDLIILENKVDKALGLDSIQEEIEGEGEEEGRDSKTSENSSSSNDEPRLISSDVWPEEEYKIMMQRTRFFIMEMRRINEALDAWTNRDVETFGKMMIDSHKSLQEDFDFKNPLLDFLVQTSLKVEGVLGSKMTGMGLGFGGGIITLIKKENIEKYCNFVTEKFSENVGKLKNELDQQRVNESEKRYEIERRAHSEHYNPVIASSEKIGKIQKYLDDGGVLSPVTHKKQSLDEQEDKKRTTPCIIKVEKPPGGCGSWGRYQKEKKKEEFFRNKEIEEESKEKKERKGSDKVLETSDVQLKSPTFYVVSPLAGARMMFVTKADLLRSAYAMPVPHPKALANSALMEFKKEFGNKPEAIGVAPATLTLFGEFMEFHLGYIICMALPMVTVTVGGRNDSVYFSVKTTSKDVEQPNIMKNPVPCVRGLHVEDRTWVNFVLGCVNEFKGHVPGFNAVINSSVPVMAGLNSCSAFQASIYTFLENLTGSCTTDLFEKADRCAKSEYEFQPTPSELVTRCSTIKFFPTFLSKEGNLMFINCKRYKISQYFFDHPSYVFLIAHCKNITTDVTIESLDERLKICANALEILGRNSLLNADLKHLRCLMKRDAPEEAIKRVKYVITEHQRTVEAVKAIKNEDYKRVGLLMSQSHASLRDDYEVSCPQIESLVSLATSVKGVLGAKMLGRGLNGTVVILVNISHAEECIRHIRDNYDSTTDKPEFYVTKPSEGAFVMNPSVDMFNVP